MVKSKYRNLPTVNVYDGRETKFPTDLLQLSILPAWYNLSIEVYSLV